MLKIVNFIILALAVGTAFFLLKDYFLEEDKGFNLECIERTEDVEVRGNSLHGFIENGETVKAYFGYYNCNDVQREDIILYDYKGNYNPLIKVVKGVPGDSFSILGGQDGAWNIIINKEALKNSLGENYVLDSRAYNLLSLYADDFKGFIPKDVYLIMGNIPEGSMDSSRFGFVSKNDFLAKVEI